MTAARRDGLIVAGLVLVVAAVFGPTTRYGFVELDDRSYVIDNPHVLGGPTPDNLGWAFTTFHQANWHPLTWISLQCDAAIGGGKPATFHATSIALHAAAASLLFLTLTALTGCAGRSAAVALLFAVHPLRVESVVWISERKDVLSQALGFATLLAWTRWVRAPSSGRYAAALGLFAAALIAKPMMVSLPVLLLLLDRCPLDRFDLVPRLREKLPFFALSAASAAVTVVAQSHGGAVVELLRLPVGTRIANACVAAVHYLAATVWPAGLAIPYPYEPDALGPARVLFCAVVLVALTVGAIRCWNKKPHLAVGWFWYLVTLLPVSGIVQVGAQSMADRYTYLPMIGPLTAMVWEIADRIRARTVAWSLVGVIVAASAVATVRLSRDSRATETLMRHTLAVTGPNPSAHLILGLALARAGRPAEGIPEIQKAVTLSARYTEAWVTLAEALVADGRAGDAIDAFRRALALDPGNRVVRSKFAASLSAEGIRALRAGDVGAAERLLREAIVIAPGDASAHGALGVVLARTDRPDEAERELAEALRLDPGNQGFRNNLERVRARRQAP